MPLKLEVTIEERRYVPLEVPDSGEPVVMHLTTLENGQRRAIIQISTMHQAQRQQIARIELNNLPSGSERPRIDLEAQFRRRKLSLNVRVNGRPAGSVQSRLKGTRGIPAVWAAAVILVLLIAGIGLYLRPWSRKADQTNASPPASAPEPSPQSSTAGTVNDAVSATPAPSVAATPKTAEPAVNPTTPSAAPAAARPAVHENWTVYFRPDDVHLTPDADRILNRVADALSSAKIEQISIIGYCAPAGSEAGRVSISVGRAAGVADYLRSHGVDLPEGADVKGVGASDPVTLDPAKQDLNRRAEILAEYTPQ